MRVSVIVTTYNRPRFLERALASYHAQNRRDFEILVADDGSGPETGEVIRRFAASTDIPVRHVWHEDEGFRKTVILNKAIAAARGEYLIFTDGDLIAQKDFVATHRDLAKPGRYIVGAYNRLPRRTTEILTNNDVGFQRAFRIWWLVRHGYRPARGFVRFLLPRFLARSLDRIGKAGIGRFPGGNASCWRADALKIGGFDERMTYGSEDREFGTRLCHAGLRPYRAKNSAFLLHLDHDRPYADPAEMERNRAILRETMRTGRVRSGHLTEPT